MCEAELPILTPPPGGLARLRVRIAEDDRARARRRWFAIPALAVAAILALWLARPRAAVDDDPEIAEARVLREPAIGDNFYWVAPTAPVPRAPPPAFVDIAAVTITP